MRDSGQIFIDDMERGYAIAVMLRNHDVPAEELDANAETVVRGLNAHDALVKGLEYIVLKAACGASSHELSQAAQAVLEEVKR